MLRSRVVRLRSSRIVHTENISFPIVSEHVARFLCIINNFFRNIFKMFFILYPPSLSTIRRICVRFVLRLFFLSSSVSFAVTSYILLYFIVIFFFFFYSCFFDFQRWNGSKTRRVDDEYPSKSYSRCSYSCAQYAAKHARQFVNSTKESSASLAATATGAR